MRSLHFSMSVPKPRMSAEHFPKQVAEDNSAKSMDRIIPERTSLKEAINIRHRSPNPPQGGDEIHGNGYLHLQYRHHVSIADAGSHYMILWMTQESTWT